MLLQGLEVVLVKTRFPENIGMAARACVNMGCPTLRLVDPERWDREKARPLATPKGQDILDAVEVHEDVAQAVAQSALVFGTTATASFLAGFLLERMGWLALNGFAVLLLVAAFGAVTWLWVQERRLVQAV